MRRDARAAAELLATRPDLGAIIGNVLKEIGAKGILPLVNRPSPWLEQLAKTGAKDQ